MDKIRVQNDFDESFTDRLPIALNPASPSESSCRPLP